MKETLKCNNLSEHDLCIRLSLSRCLFSGKFPSRPTPKARHNWFCGPLFLVYVHFTDNIQIIFLVGFSCSHVFLLFSLPAAIWLNISHSYSLFCSLSLWSISHWSLFLPPSIVSWSAVSCFLSFFSQSSFTPALLLFLLLIFFSDCLLDSFFLVLVPHFSPTHCQSCWFLLKWLLTGANMGATHFNQCYSNIQVYRSYLCASGIPAWDLELWVRTPQDAWSVISEGPTNIPLEDTGCHSCCLNQEIV